MRIDYNDIRTMPLHLQEQMGIAILEKIIHNDFSKGDPESEDETVKCDPRAFARCPYNKTCGTAADADFEEGGDCDFFNKKVLSEPYTNADWVRGMSDVELATFLYSATRACADHACEECPIGPQNCIAMAYWARQPKGDR